MLDQQLNSRHRAQQARRMRTQRRRYLIEARSVSGIRSAKLIILGCEGLSSIGSQTVERRAQ
jgi:Asp/Glu/hydantoin racemase